MKRLIVVCLHVYLLFALSSDLAAQALRRKPIFTLGVARRLEVGPEDTAQLAVDTANPNLVDARDLYGPTAVAIDSSTSPPILYISDTLNHRVLAWRNARSFSSGAEPDLILGQRDRFTALPQGPSTGVSIGFAFPLGLAVDRSGNLYIADSGNNRILRFPRPFQQDAGAIFPDIVIGQRSFQGDQPNAGGLSERTLALNVQNARVGLAFDSQGNLYVTDIGNNRLLRYAASQLNEGVNAPRATLVLGQIDFISNTAAQTRDDKSKLVLPTSVAVDSSGRIYVADRALRVLYYEASATQANGAPASRILGTRPRPVTGQPVLPTINEFSLGTAQGAPAEGVTLVDNRALVLDTGVHRALLYDPPEQWPAETQNQPSPPARIVLGQTELRNDSSPNAGQAVPNRNGLRSPAAAFSFSGELFLADTGNNRVLVFPQTTAGFAPASRVLGQTTFEVDAPNLIEGREFNSPSGVAVDTTTTPARVYVADTGNHRILGFRNLMALRTGATADLVIGQTDLQHAYINSPNNDAERPTQTGLYLPASLVVDAAGNLWVADSGNGRVLRFPRPFERAGQTQQADLVVGQANFTQKITDATDRTMRQPWGLALNPDGADPSKPTGSLVVSDLALHRVMHFRKPFSNGMSATAVIGQTFFSASTPGGAATNRFNQPRGVAVDNEDRLYVVDSVNNRVQVYSRLQSLQGEVPAVLTIPGFTGPSGFALSRRTGIFWVTEIGSTRILRFPRFEDLPRTNPAADSTLSANRPINAALDSFENLIASDATHRVLYFAPALRITNGANFAGGALSPGTISSIFPFNNGNCGNSACVPVSFGNETRSFDQLPNPIPMPTELVGIQVTLDDKPAPLYFVSPGQINFLMSMSLPSSGTAQVIVRNQATGQYFGATDLGLKSASPGFFTNPPGGSGTILAINQDNTIHTPTAYIAPGEVIALYGTGQGFVPGAPPDGSLAEGLTPTPSAPHVTIGGRHVPDENVLYSGLAPGLLGVWQLNVKIPDDAPLGNAVQVVAYMNDFSSLDPANPSRVRATIAIRRRE